MRLILGIIKKRDKFLAVAVFILVVLGLLTIRSVAPSFFIPQLFWFLIGIFIAYLVSAIDLRPLINYRWFIYGAYLLSVFLLLITQLFGPAIRQTKSWLVLGPIQFQTSELAKIALIAVLAFFFAKGHIGIARIKNIIASLVFLLIPAAFVFKQPDLGSALILFLIWLGFLFVSGVPWRYILFGIVLVSFVGVLAWNFSLADYQKDRVIGFLDPSYDTLGVNYSVIQSKIAIGSGGLFGKGYSQGTQAQLGFLPESHSDFIFASFIEEWGMIGAVFLIGIFVTLLFRIIIIGLRSQNNFFRLVCLGAVMMFLAQFILNTGSTLGLLPVTGVTFPFFSYGGSSLLINMLLIGIIQGISARSTFLRDQEI
jgi:rod shape determining protein RodA